MKAKRRQQRITSILNAARSIKTRRGFSYEQIRDDLNKNYLHPEDKVTLHAVIRWLRPSEESVNTYAEYALALSEWVEHNQQ